MQRKRYGRGGLTSEGGEGGEDGDEFFGEAVEDGDKDVFWDVFVVC